MADLTTIPNRLNFDKRECVAIIETPKNRRNKFDYDAESDLFQLGGLLPEGMSFPFDYGFIPGTLGADGDPLDVMVLMDEPAHVGCLMRVRIIGVIEADQTEDGKTIPNNRLLAVSVHSYQHEKVDSIDQINQSIVQQIENFFISYNKLHGKKFKVKSTGGPKSALALIKQGAKEFEKKHEKKSK